MSVNLDAEWKTFDDLKAYIQENPGKFTYGSPSVGSPPQIVMEYLRITEGLDTKHVPYDGGALLSALLGGNIDAYTGTAANYQAGTVNALVNFSNITTESLSEVPTLKDLGYDIAMDLVMGVVGPPGLEADIQTILHDAFQKTIEDESVIEKLENLNVAVTYGTADELQADFQNTTDLYETVLSET
ncbi:MAG TPA: tripartite tricarboxylate transporter substrate-binding protein, partial [Ureibacillus sp.]|nr:tripartite tricarboxylate transporter substrate-binding protein [Ureibacillus sp.]